MKTHSNRVGILAKRWPGNSFVWDRIQNPKQEGSGATPQQDDFRLVLGLGVRF